MFPTLSESYIFSLLILTPAVGNFQPLLVEHLGHPLGSRQRLMVKILWVGTATPFWGNFRGPAPTAIARGPHWPPAAGPSVGGSRRSQPSRALGPMSSVASARVVPYLARSDSAPGASGQYF